MSKAQLDAIDVKILTVLQENARLTNAELAEQVGLSPSPCLRRVKLLEERGVISRYAAVVDQEKVGLPVSGFVFIKLDRPNEESIDRVEKEIARCPEVVECYLMTGWCDYLLRVVTADLASYERFLKERLNKIPAIANLETSFALRQVSYMSALPIKPSRQAS